MTTAGTAGTKDTREPGVALAPQGATPAAIASPVAAWSPFSLMDQLDAKALTDEMQGIASDVLVYRIKDGGKETVGLSKAGVDECCTMLVQQGQCIREESITFKTIGEGENAEGIFECIAARYAVHPDGREVKLDQVIGVKREPLYEERAALTLDSRVPGKRWRNAGLNGGALTYGEAIDAEHPANEPTERDPQGAAMSYLQWIVEASSFDDGTKQFVRMLLDGVDPQEFNAGKRFNPFWYEHGAMKAARNARFRLIPAEMRAAVLALAKKTGKELEQDVGREQRDAMATRRPGSGESMRAREPKAEKRDPLSPPQYVRRGKDADPVLWIFAPHVDVPIDAIGKDGLYVIPDDTLAKGLRFCDKALAGEPIQKKGGARGPLDPDERASVERLQRGITEELAQRYDEQQDTPSRPTPPSEPQTSASTSDGSGTASNAT